jgi:AcrR family transcriptional regulator
MARPQGFDLADLAEAGLGVVTDDGWRAVSFRSVAERLGVSPMALYRLTPDARRLRHAVADAAAPPIPADAAAVDLVAALHTWADRAYRQLARYPGLASYVIAEWTELPSWLDIVESFLAAAAAGGVTGAPAVATVNAVYTYVLLRCQVRDGATAAPRRQLAPVRAQRKRYPLIRANLAEFTTAQTDKHFAIGLDVLIAGLRDDARRHVALQDS